VSPQSSVAFHPAVIIVVLRWYASNKLMFGAMPRKIPGVWGQSPQGAWGRIRKLSDFRIGSLAFPLDGRSSPPPLLPRQSPGAKGGQANDRETNYSDLQPGGRHFFAVVRKPTVSQSQRDSTFHPGP
jgi:hypothetical protein